MYTKASLQKHGLQGCLHNFRLSLHCSLAANFVYMHKTGYDFWRFLLLCGDSLPCLFCLPRASCFCFLAPGLAALLAAEPSASWKIWAFSSARCRLPGLCLAALLLCSAFSLRISRRLLLSDTFDNCGGADSCLNLSSRSACVSPSCNALGVLMRLLSVAHMH